MQDIIYTENKNSIPMQIDLQSNSYISKNPNMSNDSEKYKYFELKNLKGMKESSFLMIKDPFNPISIILRKNITLINSNNFEQIKEISSTNISFNITNPEEITLFSISKINYMIISQQNKICLYNLNIKSYSNFAIFELSELAKEERIISIKPLNNDVNNLI